MKVGSISDKGGRVLDATIEVGDGQIIVHSRSGSGPGARNPDYRPALETILERLTLATIKPDVYLDSRPVQQQPLEHRRIARGAELSGTLSEQFNHLVKAMNAGTDSHGAWRRIMLSTPAVSAEELARILRFSADDLSVPSDQFDHEPERLPSSVQRQVDATHIMSAVEKLIAGHDLKQFAASRDYDLLTPSGARLAPKKVFGLALELAGVVQKAVPKHFSAGWGQPSFELLEAAGYSILPKDAAKEEAQRRRERSNSDRIEAAKLADEVGADTEERLWIEGDKRMVTHLRVERKRSAKAAAAKRAAVRSANEGKLACDRCDTDWYAVYPERIAEAIFDIHHTIPLAEMDDGHETKVEDLLCLCANCHRAEHRKMALGL